MPSSRTARAAYAIGYKKPPMHTRFRKGQSGNPGGRPIKKPVRRAKALALAEAYRGVAVFENGMAVPVTAIEAIMRRQVELALEGHGPAQRAVIEAVMGIEEEEAMAAEKRNAGKAQPNGRDHHAGAVDAAQRMALFLRLTGIGSAQAHEGHRTPVQAHEGRRPSAQAPDAAASGDVPLAQSGDGAPRGGPNRIGRFFKFPVKFPVKFRVS